MKKDDIAIVLVEPRDEQNIGGAARAMANMGLSRLILLRPVKPLTAAAYRMAPGGREILAKAEVRDDTVEALQEYGLVIGTTRREGDLRRGRISPRVMAAEMASPVAAGKTAILFGREDSGLTNRELELCHRLVTVPTAAEQQSLNLAQAVMVVSYELFLAFNEELAASFVPAARQLAPLSQLEDLYAHMERSLRGIDYLHGSNPRRMMRTFRKIFSRAALDEREVQALRGIFHQIEWAAGRGRGPVKGRAGKS